MAHWVEHLTANLYVVGSNPVYMCEWDMFRYGGSTLPYAPSVTSAEDKTTRVNSIPLRHRMNGTW